MTTQEKIDALQSRIWELEVIMAKSDEHLCKCAKLGLKFGTQYPQELAEYKAANEEYNKVEVELAALKEQLVKEEFERPVIEEERDA